MEINTDKGFIKIYRDWFNEWEFNKDPLTTYFFIYCLLTANHKPKYKKGTRYKAGQFIRTEREMADACGLSRDTIRRIINELIETGLIAREEKGKSYLYTINDYKNIVGLNLDQKATKKSPKTHLNKNVKNVEEVVVGDNISPTTNYSNNFLKFWNAYGKKGYMDDTFKYFDSMNYDDETLKDIVYGAERYSEDYQDNKRGMVFPRTFLKNEIWKNYQRPKERISEEYFQGIEDAIGKL